LGFNGLFLQMLKYEAANFSTPGDRSRRFYGNDVLLIRRYPEKRMHPLVNAYREEVITEATISAPGEEDLFSLIDRYQTAVLWFAPNKRPQMM
jgi:hypothetical protein